MTQRTGHNERPLLIIKRCKARARRKLAAALAHGARNRRLKRLSTTLSHKIAIENERRAQL